MKYMIPYENFISMYPYLMSERRRNCSSTVSRLFNSQRNHDSQETRYQIKTYAKMDGRDIKIESRDIKIDRVNSIRITKSIKLTIMYYVPFFSVTSSRGLIF